MGGVIRGSEAVAAGIVTSGQLRSRYRAIYPDVHIPRNAAPTLRDRTVGAWLWSKRSAVITGRAASALHGALWVDDLAPIELIHSNCHPPRGVITRRDRIADGEYIEIEGMRVATPVRTAFDLGRYLPRGKAVAHLDALARATGIVAKDVLPLADRYRGARGVRMFKQAIDLMDGGAQSPKETWLRLLLIDAGYPRPRTQIPVYDETGYAFAYLDMGWEDVMVAAEYDGVHHQTERGRYVSDRGRLRKIDRRGWLVVTVISEDRPHQILDRVAEAWARRETEASVAKRVG